MESINALLIQQGLPQNDRLTQLYKVVMRQMKSMLDNKIANFSNLEYSSFLGGHYSKIPDISGQATNLAP